MDALQGLARHMDGQMVTDRERAMYEHTCREFGYYARREQQEFTEKLLSLPNVERITL